MHALKDIYFLNAKGLAEELRDETVSEARVVKHLIVTIILVGIGFQVPVSTEFQYHFGIVGTVVDVLYFIVAGIVSYYGVWLTYQANSKGDGVEYFLRFTALTLPVGIQVFLLFLGVALIMAVLAIPLSSAIGGKSVYVIEAMVFVVSIIYVATFFLRMRKYISIASKSEGLGGEVEHVRSEGSGGD